MSNMKAAYIEKNGAPSQIVFGELPLPKLGDHQVLVQVKAVAVDHEDIYIRSGLSEPNLSFPYILGRDVTGVVEKVGSKVTRFKPGMAVWSNNQGINGRQGTFSEYVVIDDNLLYPLPQGIDFKDAVAVLHSALTATMGIIRAAKLMAHETIFVNGGSGGVGSAVIQLAKARGSQVIASAGSDEKVAWCKNLGADFAFNYNTHSLEKEILQLCPSGIDVYWETSREPDLEKAVSLMAHRGRIVLMSGAKSSHPTLPINSFYTKELSLNGFLISNASVDELTNYALIIARCLEEHKLKAKIAKVLPLSQAAEAHKIIETDKGLWGKIVLTPN